MSVVLCPVTDDRGYDITFRTLTIIFNDRMTPPENRPSIGFHRFGMFYRLVCRSVGSTDNPSSSVRLRGAVVYIDAEVPIFRKRVHVHPAQNLIVRSVWSVPDDRVRGFDRALSSARHRGMRGRYAIDTLQFGYPKTLSEVMDDPWLSRHIAVKNFVSLDHDTDFDMYGPAAP